jgi:oxalate decarboxylase
MEDVLFLEMFKSDIYADVSLNQWLRRIPAHMVKEHFHLDDSGIERIPEKKSIVLSQ